MTIPDTIRERALRLLAEGHATLSEVAELAGTSRQLVRHWANRAGIDPGKARDRYLRELWRETTAGPVR
jgi:transposase-like protein